MEETNKKFRVPFFVPEFTEEMKNAAVNALQNERFVLGESVYKFEEEFAKYIGTKFATSVNSGNAALHLSLLALGINNKSSVITSTNSFIAAANCILMTGAKPILCDIKPEDGNIDISSTDEKADAIIPVHIYGNPCDFNSIRRMSEESKIPIIEDACQAHGAKYFDKKVGSLGDVGCFSFYPTKNMSVGGDGGMITTNNEEIQSEVISLRDNGRKSHTTFDKLGFTMRLNTVNAAIGRIQLSHLDKRNIKRRKIAELYKKYLGEDYFLTENPDGFSVFHQIIFRHKNRDQIMEHLSKNGIGTAIYYRIPIHKQPLYSYLNLTLPISEEFSNHVLTLPSYPQLSDDDVKFVCETINQIL